MTNAGRREWLLQATTMLALGLTRPLAGQQGRLIVRDEGDAGLTVLDHGTPVLRYRYATVPRPATLDPPLNEREAENWRRYGHPRSNYIHPLYGLDGVPLTDDWSRDHPHHRGIYWAWPEVRYKGELGDLHALQRVFARPTGRINWTSDADVAEIDAENEWRWDDVRPIVRERARIRVYPQGEHGRVVDLQLTFHAVVEGVTLARRQEKLYGGLNVRLAPVAHLVLTHHADPAGARPRMAWQTAAGTWQGAAGPSALTIIEHADNPRYPGDYVEYPDLPWFQPAFPAAGERYALVQGTPLVLRYRLWLHAGPPPSDAACRTQWRAFQDGR